MTRISRSVALGVVLLGAACAPFAAPAPSPFDGPDAAPAALATELSIEVRNEYWLPMRVWAEWRGVRRFLGDVAPGATGTFRIPSSLAQRFGPFQLYADPTGSADEVRTAPIDVGDGRHVEWRLKQVIYNSRVRVM